jgi:tRNA A58 N-methylase Trm61
MKLFAVVLLAALPCAAQGAFGHKSSEYYKKSLAPYVVSPQQIVDKMLEAASIKPGETVYDLGCGDGRVLITAAQRFGAKAVGVELSPSVAKTAEENVKRQNLQNEVKVIQGDLMAVNLAPADVVTIYLETSSNDLLRPNLEKSLRPGSRVISYEFPVPGWKPKHVEKISAYNRTHQIYIYVMPPSK